MLSLESCKLFSNLSAEELTDLNNASKSIAVAAGQKIFTEGDVGDSLYVILEGKFEIWAEVNPNGKVRVLTKLGSGDFFGEMAVLDDEPRSATATAVTDSHVLFIPKVHLQSMLDRSPKFAIILMREFSLRLRDFNQKYLEEVIHAERLAMVGMFARSIVHDFKNPLNIISLASDFARETNLSPAKRKTALDRIQYQVQRIGNMINELLEFTHESSPDIVMESASFGEYVQQVIQELRLEIEDKGIVIEMPEKMPEHRALFDPRRMSHLIYNLCHNAVEAMPEGGRLVISMEVRDDHIITSIRDTGEGINSKIENRIFEAFATHGKQNGTGLGLSICKRIIEDHKGNITARNLTEGGALFQFRLPLAVSCKTNNPTEYA